MKITDYMTEAEVYGKYDATDLQTKFYIERCVTVRVGKQKYYDIMKIKEIEGKLKCRE